MGIGADMYDAVNRNRSGGAMTRGVMKGVLQRVSDNPMFQAYDELADIPRDAGRRGGGIGGWLGASVGTYGSKRVAQMIPAGVGTTARQLDPLMRDTRDKEKDVEGMLRIVQNKIPFASRWLPPKVDVMGQVVKRDLVGSSSPLSTATPETEEKARVLAEMVRTQAQVEYPKQGKGESDEDYIERAGKIGEEAFRSMAALMSSAEYQNMDFVAQRLALKEAGEEAKEGFKPESESEEAKEKRTAEKKKKEENPD